MMLPVRRRGFRPGAASAEKALGEAPSRCAPVEALEHSRVDGRQRERALKESVVEA